MIRLAVQVRGVVQGVGFRPFVHGMARRHGLSGWVRNQADEVRLEVQGAEAAVRQFLHALAHRPPPGARLEALETSPLAVRSEEGFRITDSAVDVVAGLALPADHATCDACLTESESPGERRYRYPFTNCAHCGPRFTIVEALPFDRPRTSMREFRMCAACAAEYADPADRRFHAQAIACPSCGPQVRMLSADGTERTHDEDAILAAAAALLDGELVALKGLGGFHLLADATNAAAVGELRRRKGRDAKPFAVMFPSLAALRSVCVVSPAEAQWLTAPAAPIVLVRRRPTASGDLRIAAAVAPGNPRIGALLPYTPLHRLLLNAVQRPLVCTSGNRSDEPICIETAEALSRLSGVVDRFVVHDRRIVRPVDDSVVRVSGAEMHMLRRARGFAPLAVPLPVATPSASVLALGGHLKATITVAARGQAVVSQHLGDLTSPEARQWHERTARELLACISVVPDVVACDLHPDYASTLLAERLAADWRVPLCRVQHHHAHVAACVVEHGLTGPVLGLVWDGSGLGSDGVLWGGEALVVDGATARRVAHLRPFPLPGGERAMREPRRAALGLLYEIVGQAAGPELAALFPDLSVAALLQMMERRVGCPRTTSVGRLFDAVAALLGIRVTGGFEGQAAMEVEYAADDGGECGAYSVPLTGGSPAVADWQPLVEALRRERAGGVPATVCAARFHGALVQLAEDVARRVNLPRVVLTGGCFQNARLNDAIRVRLVRQGFRVYVPQRYPPNDGGLSLGQAAVAGWQKGQGA